MAYKERWKILFSSLLLRILTKLGDGENEPVDHRSGCVATSPTTDEGEKTARVTVIGNVQISPNALELLSLGPSFAPTQQISAVTYRKVVGSLQRFRDRLRIKVKHDSQTLSSSNFSRRVYPSIPFPQSCYKEPEPNTEADIKFRILSSGILNILNRYKSVKKSNLSCSQWQGFKKLRELTTNGVVRISVGDKGVRS